MDANLQCMFAGDSSLFLDPMFSGVSLQSLLTLNPSLFSDYTVAGGFPTLAFLTDDPLPLSLGVEATDADQSSPTPIPKIEGEDKKLLVPKNELLPHLSTQDSGGLGLTSPSHHQPFNLFSKYEPSSHFYGHDDSPAAFHRLPELRSVERHPPEELSSSSSAAYTLQKRLRLDSLKNWSTHHHPMAAPHHTYPYSPTVGFNPLFPAATTTTSSFHGKQSTNNPSLDDAPLVRGKAPSASVNIPQSNLARQRRQKLSEKTRCLQKLMPWDKKMDQATLLEEAYKYVKFLQAQLCVLQSMPSSASDTTSPFLINGDHPKLKNGNGGSGVVFGDLERLNRNQVLQVLVNSPVAQTMLYSQGFCVFSMEQLALLRKMSERRLLLQQMMISDHASSKAFFN